MPRIRKPAPGEGEPDTLSPEDVAGLAPTESAEPAPARKTPLPPQAPPEATEPRVVVRQLNAEGDVMGEPRTWPMSEVGPGFRDRAARRAWIRQAAGPGRYLVSLESPDGDPIPGTVPWVDDVERGSGAGSVAGSVAGPMAAPMATPGLPAAAPAAAPGLLRLLQPQANEVEKLMTWMMRDSQERRERDEREREERRREEAERREREERGRREREEAERRERDERRREEAERREREERRAEQRNALFLGVAQVAAPLLLKMVDRPVPAPNNDTAALMNLVTSVMQKTTEQSLEASSRLVELTMQKAEKAATLEPSRPSGWDRLADLAQAALPIVASQLVPQAQAAAAPLPAPALPVVPMAQDIPMPVPAPAPVPSPAPAPAMPPAPVDVAALAAACEIPTDAAGLRLALHALRAMHTYDHSEAEAAALFRLAADSIPAEVRPAVIAGDMAKLMQAGQPLVMADAALLRWLTAEGGGTWLPEAVPHLAKLIRETAPAG